MPQITDIRPQKTHRTGEPRFNIYLDGQFGFAVPAVALAKAGLKIDQQLSQEEIDKLVKENDFLKFYDHVLKFLSFRPRSEKEIRDWFRKKEVGKETQKLIAAKLSRLGYINDEEFAKWWIEQRTTFRPMGEYAIARELKQKGISQDIITPLLHSLAASCPEVDLAKKAAEKKIKLYNNLPQLQFRQKLSAFLARRGFSWEVIEDVIDEIEKK